MKVDIDPDVIPDRYEAVAFRVPRPKEYFLSSMGTVEMRMLSTPTEPRLVLKEKELKWRPLNNDELPQLLGVQIRHKDGFPRYIVSKVKIVNNNEMLIMLPDLTCVTAKKLFDHYCYINGDPIGVKK